MEHLKKGTWLEMIWNKKSWTSKTALSEVKFFSGGDLWY